MMSLRKLLIRSLLGFKGLAAPRRRCVWRVYRQMVRWSQSTPETYAEAMTDRLRRMLLHAHTHTAYYRELLSDVGVVRDGQVHLDKFSELPMLTKDTIRTRPDELLSDERHRRRLYTNTSGGSTGEPVAFVQDDLYHDWNWATALYYNHMVGKEPGQPEAKLWGSQRDILEGGIGLRARVENACYNRLPLNSFMMSAATMDDYVERLRRFRPHSLWSYVDSACELARHVERNGLDLPPIPVTILTSGTVTEPLRELVERALQTRVYNQYGSREVGPIACECSERTGLHVFDWATHVEIVDASGRPVAPGEMGEVCVTLLTNFSMPLIRFRIGDTAVATRTPCPCGRPMPLLQSVAGRVTDHFVRRDGTLVHGQYFAFIFYHRPWVRRFQFVQEDYDHVVCVVQVVEQPGQAERAEVEQIIRTAMGEECRVDWRFVDELPPSASGKYLYTLSKVAR